MPDREVPVPGLPRSQAGSQPQHLLITLLGDYWFLRSEHIPSAALVELLGEFGISPVGARAALSRLARRGLLVSSKQGRNTFYGLSERAAAVLEEGAHHIFEFASHEPRWDGRWTFVAFSVPEERRHVRPLLRTRLRWLGFAPLYDGLWVSPHPPPPALTDALAELDVASFTVVVGEAIPHAGAVDPISAWNLDGLRADYDAFVARFAPLRTRVRSGAVTLAEGLVARTEIMDSWRNMPSLEPELPVELLPQGWPRGDARALFIEVYDALGPVAEARVREILQRFAPELAALVTHHTDVRLATP
jgi:phenylacetic acid degradation operon negative regulatory protein